LGRVLRSAIWISRGGCCCCWCHRLCSWRGVSTDTSCGSSSLHPDSGACG
jgi:hypothetical protein